MIHAQRPIYYNLAPACIRRNWISAGAIEPPSATWSRFLDQRAPELWRVSSRAPSSGAARALSSISWKRSAPESGLARRC